MALYMYKRAEHQKLHNKTTLKNLKNPDMQMMIMILLLCSVIITILFFTKGGKSNTPSSPPRLPLIGNLHQLGHHPHRSLCFLSHRYGPLMLLHFGSVPVLVVSSMESAKEVLKTHDRVFASRPRSKIFQKLLYDGQDVAAAPYGEYWRQMKSVCVLHLLSNKMVRSFRNVREEEMSLMMEKIRKASSLPVNLSELLANLTNDVICRVALGRKYGCETDFKELMERLTRLLGVFSVGTYVPWLAWIDWIRGLDSQLEKLRNDVDEFLERVLQDHEDGDGGDRTDFVDVLLKIQREKSVGFDIDRVSIKAIILDVFVGGTDTSYTLMEWVMTELLRHPECLRRLQEEVRTICKGKSSVLEEDIQDMNYLKAVIKETLRLHPPLPLMVPHESTHDVRLRNYRIPAGTQVMINAWAIGREVETWGPDAEEFRPERHLHSSVDFRGQDFELIPFGAGRRICPAISFAVVLNEVVLANLVHQFGWISTEDQAEVAESTGIAIHRMFPLYAIASSTS
ncbi:unnamed protein product [Brassica rapa]|uniref:Uncharacterized protein n=2 Tax=Brassica campestris TaxID=3711 RepID=A0A8D9DAZ1_BRACM|nr:unnamed protein product [Brassica rapa]